MLAPAMAEAKVTTLRTTYFDFSFKVIDVPPLQPSEDQPPSSGDVAIVRARYTAGRTVVAYDRTACTVVDWPHAVCTISFSLKGGHLVATDQFDATSRGVQRIAISGGTGAYRNARGEVVFRQTSDTRGTAVFTIIT